MAIKVSEKLSASLEDYLEAIYHLTAGQGVGRSKDIAEAMGAAATEMDISDKAVAAANNMEAFAQSVGLNQRLKDLGVTEDQLNECAELSMSDGSIIYNPKMVMDAEEVLRIYRMAW